MPMRGLCRTPPRIWGSIIAFHTMRHPATVAWRFLGLAPQCFTVIFCTGVYVRRVTYGCTNEHTCVRIRTGSPTERSIFFHGYSLTYFFLCHSNGQSLILCMKKMKNFKDDSQQQQQTSDLDIAPERHTFQSPLKKEIV